MIEQALFTLLSTTPAITALVGQQVYPVTLPQGVVYPAVSYFKLTGAREHLLSGPSGVAHPQFQVDCWGRAPDGGSVGYLQAKQVAEQIRIALNGFAGTVDGVTIQGILCPDDHDVPDETETDVYHVVLELTIWHKE